MLDNYNQLKPREKEFFLALCLSYRLLGVREAQDLATAFQFSRRAGEDLVDYLRYLGLIEFRNHGTYMWGAEITVPAEEIYLQLSNFYPEQVKILLRKIRQKFWFREDADSPQVLYASYIRLLSSYKRLGKGSLTNWGEKVVAMSGYDRPRLLARMRSLFLLTMSSEEFAPLFKTLPKEFIPVLWEDVFSFFFYESPYELATDTAEGWLSQVGGHLKDNIKSFFDLTYRLPYTGFSELSSINQNGFFESYFVLAVKNACEGDFKTAGKLICRAQKTYFDHIKETFFDYKSPFFGKAEHNIVLAAILFFDRNTPATSRKIASLFKKTEFLEYDILLQEFMRLIFLYAQTPDAVSEAQKINVCRLISDAKGPMMTFAAAVLYRIFDEDRFRELLEERLPKDKDKLAPFFRREALAALNPKDPEVQKLTEELAVPSLFSSFKTLSKWQLSLDKLLALTQGFKKTKGTSKARIVYLYSDTDGLSPYLQKTRNGSTWTKGTEISLRNFFKGLPEMDEVDRKVKDRIKVFDGRYYEIDAPAALWELAESGKVYQCLEPMLPLEVKRDRLRIEVDRNSEGDFGIKTNMDFFGDGLGKQEFAVKENEDGSLSAFRNSDNEREVLSVVKGLRTLPAQAKPELGKLLENLSAEIPVSSELLKNSSNLEVVKASSKITFRIVPDSGGIDFRIKAFVRPADGCDLSLIPGEGLDTVAANVYRTPKSLVRNLKEEKENFTKISAALEDFLSWSDDDRSWTVETKECLEFMEILRQHQDICDIEWPEGAKLTVNRTPISFPDLKIQINSIDRWFSLDGTVSIDGKTQLKINEILDRLKDRVGNFIHLEGAEYIAISAKLRKHLELLQDISTKKKDKLEISRFSGEVLEDLRSNGAEISGDRAYRDLQKRMLEAEDKEYSVPSALAATMRDYQQEGFVWLSRLADWGAGAILADDMGLGKTVQAIALLLSRKDSGPSLVVVPTSVLFNWKSEFTRFAPTLKIADFNSGDREKILKEIKQYDVLLCTYGVMNSEIDALKEMDWNVAVLDEAHSIKNKATQTSHSVMKLRSAARLLLSGTPIQNHLNEIWNLFEFANPGYLGSYQQFGERFILPIEKKKDKERQNLLKQLISPFILRRTKTDVLSELPERTELQIPVELSEEEMAVYENIRSRTLAGLESSDINPIEALVALTKLRLAACSPELVEKGLKLPSTKTHVFMELVKELIENKHRALVFSQFTAHLALIRKALEKAGIKYLYMDGSVPAAQRKKLVEEFQNGDMPLFLISLKAGGTGLNLTAADYVIHLDPWWNPAVEDQASDRAYRIGQKRPVTIYKLIAKNTVEESILELHKTKKNLADALLEGTDVAKQLSKEEILKLLQLSS